MTHTEKLVSVLRAANPDIGVYANAIPQVEGRDIREAATFIEAGDIRASNFSGSVLVRTVFRVQFRAVTYERSEELSRRFENEAGRFVPPITISDVGSVYDDDLKLQLRELTVQVR